VLLGVLAARMLGPSDAFDQTQPKTVAYTTDILVNGRWLLPLERGEVPATKPPLYNWLAAPAVRLLGFSFDLAHRAPSIAALLLCWWLVVRLGNSIDRAWRESDRDHEAPSLGWLAGLMFAANYTIFKLGYLARPDMLLTLWLLLGWMSATKLLTKARESGPDSPRAARWLAAGFWLCVALAWLTKGPAALVLIAYAIIAPRAIVGSWRAGRILGWWWGLPLSLAPIAAWTSAVYAIDPVHVREQLWGQEILGRIMGTGQEGAREGPIAWVKGLPNLLLYFVVRFAPWSVLSILAMVELWKRAPGGASERRWNRLPHPSGAWLCGAAVFIVIVVVLFTLSAGKRADYVAAAFAPGALLAAAWLVRLPPRLGNAAPWLAPATAGVALVAMTMVNIAQPGAPVRGFGPAIAEFIHEVDAVRRDDARPVAFVWTGTSHLKAYLGASEPDDEARLAALIDAGAPFLVISTTIGAPLEHWLEANGRSATSRQVIDSAMLPLEHGWPGQVALYEVTP
jgi:4-amino-4-deoxy-L-arabinose transferase-like glycosyltransferase